MLSACWEAKCLRMEGEEQKEGRRDESGRRCVGPIIQYKRISTSFKFSKTLTQFCFLTGILFFELDAAGRLAETSLRHYY